MTLTVRFTIPGTPVPLARARRDGRSNHWHTPQRSIDYQKKVRSHALLAGCPLFAKGCELELRICLPDRRRRDRDNIEKGIVDALQGRWNRKLKLWEKTPIAWKDDHDIGPVARRWEIDAKFPRVEVIIRGERCSATS